MIQWLVIEYVEYPNLYIQKKIDDAMDRGLSRGLVFEWMKDALRKKNESKV